ncbi:MAG: BamA/TamA family outer membrane protein [Bacteroidales bacterium]|nr:BamA/TamA family outer membrane protein [Bacteroidales bacterium]
MKHVQLRFIFIFIALSLIPNIKAQDSPGKIAHDSSTINTICPQQDVFDLIWKKKSFNPEIPSRRVSAIILPVIGLSPATGFQFGAGATLSWLMKNHPETKLSAGVASLMLTTMKQMIFQVKTNIFLDRNLWFAQTDWRLYLYRLSTYPLGTGPGYVSHLSGSPNDPAGYIEVQEDFPMHYNWVKFHNVLSRAVTGNFYVGMGYHLDAHYDIEDLSLNTDSLGYTITPHYAYSMINGFDPKQYISSGLSLNFAYDSRDNIINAYRGIYVNINYRYNTQWLGSSQEGSILWTEFRTYIGLSKRVPRNLLAFWVYGSFVVSGNIPFLDLMSNGFDQMNSSGRGYAQGRWRGEDFVYGEVEYRFPISPCSKILGGVIFANFTTASNRERKIPLFGFLKPGAGFGLRIMIGKNDRTNLLIDFGLGQQSDGFYLQAQEVF